MTQEFPTWLISVNGGPPVERSARLAITAVAEHLTSMGLRYGDHKVLCWAKPLPIVRSSNVRQLRRKV